MSLARARARWEADRNTHCAPVAAAQARRTHSCLDHATAKLVMQQLDADEPIERKEDVDDGERQPRRRKRQRRPQTAAALLQQLHERVASEEQNWLTSLGLIRPHETRDPAETALHFMARLSLERRLQPCMPQSQVRSWLSTDTIERALLSMAQVTRHHISVVLAPNRWDIFRTPSSESDRKELHEWFAIITGRVWDGYVANRVLRRVYARRHGLRSEGQHVAAAASSIAKLASKRANQSESHTLPIPGFRYRWRWIIVPVHSIRRQHWTIVVIHRPSARVEWFDSFGMPYEAQSIREWARDTAEGRFVSTLTQWLQRHVRLRKDTDRWTFTRNRMVHQHGGTECGMYVVWYAMMRIYGATPGELDSERMPDKAVCALRNRVFRIVPDRFCGRSQDNKRNVRANVDDRDPDRWPEGVVWPTGSALPRRSKRGERTTAPPAPSLAKQDQPLSASEWSRVPQDVRDAYDHEHKRFRDQGPIPPDQSSMAARLQARAWIRSFTDNQRETEDAQLDVSSPRVASNDDDGDEMDEKHVDTVAPQRRLRPQSIIAIDDDLMDSLRPPVRAQDMDDMDTSSAPNSPAYEESIQRALDTQPAIASEQATSSSSRSRRAAIRM